MTGAEIAAEIVLDRLDRLETKIDALVDRVNDLRVWRAYVLGGSAAVAALVSIAIQWL